METSAPWPLYSRGKGADRGDGVKTFLPPREGPSGASHSAWWDAVDTPGPARAAPTPQHGQAHGPSGRRLCLEGSAPTCPPQGALTDSQGNHGMQTTTDHDQASESETPRRLTPCCAPVPSAERDCRDVPGAQDQPGQEAPVLQGMSWKQRKESLPSWDRGPLREPHVGPWR